MTYVAPLIGVTGRAQHGKDTIGQRLVERWGFERFAFADGVKDAALALDPIIEYQTTYMDGVFMDVKTRTTRLSSLVRDHGWEGAKNIPEVRRILQVLGTEVGRNIMGERVWIHALHHKIVQRWDQEEHRLLEELPFPGVPVVVTDVRFPNEADYIHRHGGLLLRAYRPGFDNSVDETHASERYVSTLDADYEVVNDGSIEDLHTKVDAIMEEVYGLASDGVPEETTEAIRQSLRYAGSF